MQTYVIGTVSAVNSHHYHRLHYFGHIPLHSRWSFRGSGCPGLRFAAVLRTAPVGRSLTIPCALRQLFSDPVVATRQRGRHSAPSTGTLREWIRLGDIKLVIPEPQVGQKFEQRRKKSELVTSVETLVVVDVSRNWEAANQGFVLLVDPTNRKGISSFAYTRLIKINLEDEWVALHRSGQLIDATS